MKHPYIIQKDRVTVVVNGKPFVIANTHANYAGVMEAIRTDDEQMLERYVDTSAAIVTMTNGAFTVRNGVLYHEERPIVNSLTARIIDMLNKGFNVTPMLNFLKNLLQNPSSRAVEELYTFLEYGNLPITEDGHFLAFKRVRDDYLDCHSGTVLNKPADMLTEADMARIGVKVGEDGVLVKVEDGQTVVSMERNRVNDNSSATCSHGLHFCSYEYLEYFRGARMVVLKINPRDVVSIPTDYNNTKGRCCRYVVLQEIAVEYASKAFVDPVQNSAFDRITTDGWFFDDEDEDENEDDYMFEDEYEFDDEDDAEEDEYDEYDEDEDDYDDDEEEDEDDAEDDDEEEACDCEYCRAPCDCEECNPHRGNDWGDNYDDV